MRLSGLGPGPSLFIQRQGQNNGQVDELENKSANGVEKSGDASSEQKTPDAPSGQVDDPLDDPQVRAEVMELQTIEDKVIAHEQAHKAVGGEFAGSATYGYSVGPDGKRYITSGEVSISVPGTGEPEEMMRAMETVKRAALAPANPSGQDQRVAASASAKIISLQSDIARQKAAEAYGTTDGEKTGDGNPKSNEKLEGPHAQPPNEREHIDIVI